MRGDRKCMVCGKKYNFCTICGKGNPYDTWKYIYCSEDCRKLFNIASDWTANKINATAAKIKLDEINIPPLENLHSSLRKNIDDIYSNSSV